MPSNANVRDNDGNYVSVPTEAPADPGDDYITQDELEEALRNLDLPEPVINEFVTNIATSETFVTELVTNETYITQLTEEQTFIEQTVNQITEVEENNTYITQITQNSTFITNVDARINGKKGQVSGLASLDSSSKLTAAQIPTKLTKRAVNFIIDGGGSAITTGVKGDVEIPFAWTDIESWRILADQSGSIVVNVWKDTYGNFPPVVGDKITASAPPTLSSAAKAESTSLSGWTKTGAAGDILRFNVDSITTVTRVTVSLVLVI